MQQQLEPKISPAAEKFYLELAADPVRETDFCELDLLLDRVLSNPNGEQFKLAGRLEGKCFRAKSRNFAVIYRTVGHVLTIIAIVPIHDGPTPYEIWTRMVESGAHVDFLKLL